LSEVYYNHGFAKTTVTFSGAFMNFDVEFEQEDDGRWIAEITEIPGVLAYGVTPLQAGARARALALRVLADRLENEVSIPGINSIAFVDRYEQMAVN
jgi:predicted RNase H-like HicB family nuclease